jgi:hypothetical protein
MSDRKPAREWHLTKGAVQSGGRWIDIVVADGPIPGALERIVVREVAIEAAANGPIPGDLEYILDCEVSPEDVEADDEQAG